MDKMNDYKIIALTVSHYQTLVSELQSLRTLFLTYHIRYHSTPKPFKSVTWKYSVSCSCKCDFEENLVAALKASSMNTTCKLDA